MKFRNSMNELSDVQQDFSISKKLKLWEILDLNWLSKKKIHFKISHYLRFQAGKWWPIGPWLDKFLLNNEKCLFVIDTRLVVTCPIRTHCPCDHQIIRYIYVGIYYVGELFCWYDSIVPYKLCYIFIVAPLCILNVECSSRNFACCNGFDESNVFVRAGNYIRVIYLLFRLK
jgi:hypothetical protein